jgi:hypothetical protein
MTLTTTGNARLHMNLFITKNEGGKKINNENRWNGGLIMFMRYLCEMFSSKITFLETVIAF